MGKTRLATEVARDLAGAYKHGMWLTELDSTSDVLRSAFPYPRLPGRGDHCPVLQITGRSRDTLCPRRN